MTNAHEDWDASIGMRERDKGVFKERLRATTDPENCMSFVQLGINNKEVIESDETGEQMLRVLKFIEEAGGEAVSNQVSFLKLHFRTMPASARTRIQPQADEIFRRWWDYIDSLE